MEQIYKAPAVQEGNNKPLSAFLPLKNMEAGFKIEGIHRGHFESKKKPGLFFHVFQKGEESYGVGTCKILDEKITKAKEIAAEKNVELPYLSITYLGKKPTKSGGSYYSFLDADIFKSPESTSNKIDSTEIPF